MHEEIDGAVSMDDIPMRTEEWVVKHHATPELRRWAIEQAIKAGATNTGWANVENVAQGYVEYVLEGKK